ncbi:hypothetical protein HMPREF2656_09235 [Corynebacterium sp. HMSC034B08]|nr:hypothetical protein HMPREF2656_09235 [Corynebacterium sp. HMSC034B08]
MTREVAALIAQMPFILYALLSLAVVIAVPHSQWNLLAVAAPAFSRAHHQQALHHTKGRNPDLCPLFQRNHPSNLFRMGYFSRSVLGYFSKSADRQEHRRRKLKRH